MRANQYIYTLCKDNDMGALGFSEYSRSLDITEEEAKEIKKIMEYKALNEFKYLTSEELKATELDPKAKKCPYSFGFFKLKSGRYCIALSTLLAQYKLLDAPNADPRTGNYILHALVVPEEEMEFYPTDLFGNGILKNDMTVEELEASYPVPPLPQLEIDEVESFISDEMIEAFVRANKEKFVQLVTIGLEGIKRNLSVYINDTRENLIIWMAAIQKLFPLKLASMIHFVTYELNYDKYNTPLNRMDMLFVGIKNGARGFEYGSAVNNSSVLCIDLEPEQAICSSEIGYLEYACTMANLYEEGMDSVYEFAEFLNRLSLDKLDEKLEEACKLYMAMEEKYPYSGDVLAFAEQYAEDSLNEEIVEKIAMLITNGRWTSEVNEDVIKYIFQYAGYRILNFYPMCDEYIKNNIQKYRGGKEGNLLKFLLESQPNVYMDYMRYVSEEEHFLPLLREIRNKKGEMYVLSYFAIFLPVLEELYETRQVIWQEFLVECQIIVGRKKRMEIISMLDVSIKNKNILKETVKILCECQNFNREAVLDAMGSWMEKTNPKVATYVRRILRQSDDYADIVIYLDSLMISKSNNPSQEFWGLYNMNYIKTDKDISHLVQALLDRDSKLKTVSEIVDKIPYGMYKNADLSKAVEVEFLKLSWNEVQELEDSLYDKLETVVSPDVFGKAYFVIAARRLKKNAYRSEGLCEFFEAKNLYIRILEKKEQKAYLEKELPEFYSITRSRNDVEFLVSHFLDKEKPEIFFGILSKILKLEDEKKRQLFMENLAIVYGPEYKNYMKEDGSEKSNFVGGLKKIFGKK